MGFSNVDRRPKGSQAPGQNCNLAMQFCQVPIVLDDDVAVLFGELHRRCRFGIVNTLTGVKPDCNVE